MPIGAISSVAPTSATVEATPVATAHSSKFADNSQSHSTTASVPVNTSASVTAPVETSSLHSSQTQMAANADQQGTPAAVFSTTVAGKDYSGSVEEANGVYMVSVPTIPEVTASGPDVLQAESNLAIKIDTVV